MPQTSMPAGRKKRCSAGEPHPAPTAPDASALDAAMADMALVDLEGALKGVARSLERHELLGLDASPGCTPVLDPLRKLRSYRELMGRYGIQVCKA